MAWSEARLSSKVRKIGGILFMQTTKVVLNPQIAGLLRNYGKADSRSRCVLYDVCT